MINKYSHSLSIKFIDTICKTKSGTPIKLVRGSFFQSSGWQEIFNRGIVVKNKLNQYFPSPDFKNYIGKVVRSKHDFMFVHVEELGQDIYVHEIFSNNALLNDIVKIWVFPNNEDGYIEQIIEHGNKEIVGRISYRPKPHVIPQSNELNIKIYLEENSVIASPNDVVVVKITSYDVPMMGVISSVLGNINNPGVDILSKVYESRVPYEFSEATNNQLKDIPVDLIVSDEMLKERRDFRDRLIVTIDGEDAKDFDDAIEVEKIENGYFVGVHIADVTHYVLEKEPLDNDALARGTSIYLADRVIPMLPFKLSNGICSLNPNQDRLTMSCLMEIDEQGKVISCEVTPSIIKSKHRLTYTEVNDLFKNKKKASDDLSKMLFLAKKVSNLIRRERMGRGSVELNVEEAKLIINDEGKVVDIIKRVQDEAEKLIEDLMIAANESVASHVFYQELPFVYRVHDEPAKKKIDQLIPLLNNLGYSLNAKNGIHPNQIQSVINKSKGDGLEEIVSQLILRSLAKAKYSEDNIGHFGLGSDIYTHFTSPIRRYPDLLVHRLLKLYREDITQIDLEKLLYKISDIAKSNSISERKAIDLERSVTSMKMAEYMLDHIGDEYNGKVSGIIDSGIFLVLDNLVEGLVKFENIDYDFFIYDPKKMQAVGRNTHRIIRLGQEFRIEVLNASKATGRVEFVLADERSFNTMPLKGAGIKKKLRGK